MKFPKRFICASREYATLEKSVPAPYLRRTFELSRSAEKAEIIICGLGFYQLFVNGHPVTKGKLAPYICNPDHVLPYDTYSVSQYLRQGENVLGILLGNGMQNPWGSMEWYFDRAPWRSAPLTALRVDITLQDGKELSFESDETFRWMPSPYQKDDLRMGIIYDAAAEIDGWNLPGFDDGDWKKVEYAQPPRGEAVLCAAEPIVVAEERRPVRILPQDGGFLYDFGVNGAGVCRLKIRGERGQRIHFAFSDFLERDGSFSQRGYFCPREPEYRAQHQEYICRGGGEEIFEPDFTYYGFRYVLVTGLHPEQAEKTLLTYLVMNSRLEERGGFRCSEELLNQLQEMTRRSTLSNFYYFPTDCPHREKNGWTGDISLSVEHTLLNLSAENSYREWMRSVRKDQSEEGSLNGIIPSSEWGRNYGPVWDGVVVNIPYYTYVYRGDRKILEENLTAIWRYVSFLPTKYNSHGLVSYGLGDWCAPGCRCNPKAPVEVTNSICAYDIYQKAAYLFEQTGWKMQKDVCVALAEEIRSSIRKKLIDFSTMTVEGDTQTGQAMAIFYGIFEEGEKQKAFEVLLRQLEDCGRHMDTGVLGARVLFHVLSDFGYTDLALEVMLNPTEPSYGVWARRGETTLCEDLIDENGSVNSRNHHFFGDISSWFIQSLAGIRYNPFRNNWKEVHIAPRFAKSISWAEGFHICPRGRILSRWEKRENAIYLTLDIPEHMEGKILLENGYVFSDGRHWKPVKSGKYEIVKKSNALYYCETAK